MKEKTMHEQPVVYDKHTHAKDKPEYHQSSLSHYFKCPMMFELSKRHSPNIGPGTENVMREGNIFEHFVFDANKHDSDISELIGKKKKATIDNIRQQADAVRPIFKNGTPFVKLFLDCGDYDLAGEADYEGEIEYTDEFGEVHYWEDAFGDLKRTGDINRVWGWKINKEDYLQAVQYTYIRWKETGKIKPFVFIVVESGYIEKPMVLCLEAKITEKVFTDWYEPFLEMVHTDSFPEAKVSEKLCLGEKSPNGRCWFLEHCEQGRNFAGGYKYVEVEDLETILLEDGN